MKSSTYMTCIDIFADLKKSQKKELMSFFKKENYGKGETIFTPYEDYDSIFLIHKGSVEIYQISAKGKKIIIDVLQEGDLFINYPLFLDHSIIKMTDFAETKTEAIIYRMDKKDFRSLLIKYPQVSLNVIKLLSIKLNEADSRIKDLALNNATTRAINELLRLSWKYGSSSDDSIKLSIRITHEEFAEMIGTSRETATKILKKLHNLSFISFSKDKHIIINTKKIKEPI